MKNRYNIHQPYPTTMEDENKIVTSIDVLALLLRRFLIDFPYKESKKQIKALYAAWVYNTSSVAAPHEHASMLIFTDQLKELIKEADKILKEKK